MQPAHERRERADTRYFELLIRTGDLLSASLDFHQTLENVCEAVTQSIADICIVDLGEPGNVRLAAAAHREGGYTQQLEAAGIHLTSEPGRPKHPVCDVLETGKAFFADRIDEQWIEVHATRAEHGEFLRTLAYTSMVVVPLTSQVFGMIGALTIATVRGGRAPLDGRVLPFARDLGRRCGGAIGKARMHRETVEVLERFQRAALPRVLPHDPRIAIDTHYAPASDVLALGGDWYDVFPLPTGALGISIGDISGHGVEAAALMASMRDAVRTALVAREDVAHALWAADYVLRSEVHDSFSTAMLAILDLQSGEMTFASAGHPGPKLYVPSQDRIVEPLTDRTIPLGFGDMLDEPAREQRVTLEPGATLVFYTDGLVEEQRDVLSGERALEDVMLDASWRDGETPAQRLRERLVPGAARDDVAIIVVRFLDHSV